MKKLIKLITLSITLVVISLSVVLSLNNKESKVSATDIDNPTLSVYKKNLSYSSEIYIMYAVSYSGFNPETYPVKMLFYNTIQTEYTKDNATYEVATSGKIVVSDVSCLVYASKGLSAKQMTEDIYARAYVEIEDQIIYSEVVKYSVLEYTYESMGKVNEKITNLLLAMKEYGSCAQINFNYLLDRLANATYYNVNVVGGTLEDGFTQGRFNSTEEFTLVAPIKEGYEFVNWTNSQGIEVSTEAIYTTTTSKDETFTANYQENIPLILSYSIDVEYNSGYGADLPNIPLTITFEYNNEIVEEWVDWDASTFVPRQIGKQKIYGTLANNNYDIEELSIEINVLPYSFSLDEKTNEYEIEKYYGQNNEAVIPDVINDLPVTKIGPKTFSGHSSLESVVIPNSVTHIEDYAFKGCTSLTNIDIPNNVTYIGSFVFEECTSLLSIKIPSGVLCVKYSTFDSCTNLKSIELPSTITSIESYAFADCESLTSIEIPNSVTHIEGYAFKGCTSLTSIDIPNNVTSIGYSLFSYCSNLTSIKIPFLGNNLLETENKYLGYFFGGDIDHPSIPTSLKEVIVTLEKNIGYKAFYNCDSLTSIELSNNVTDIGASAFFNCYSLIDMNIPNSVTNIGNSAFAYCDSLTSIEIPNSVTNIGNSAFYSCDSLTSIEIPNSVTSIGASAFYHCVSLTSIEIPNSVTNIGEAAFAICNNLISIKFEDNSVLTSFDDSLFEYCESLESVQIPKSLTSISESAFNSCFSLTKIYYQGTIDNWCNIEFESENSNPMYYAENFYTKDENNLWVEETELVISNNVIEISDYAFYNFNKITSIVVSNSVVKIGNSVFEDCKNLTSITLPASVTEIGRYTFGDCTNLNDVYYEGTIEDWCYILFSIYDGSNPMDNGNNFYLRNENDEWEEVTEITIPNSIEEIGYRQFLGFNNLTSITFPIGIITIKQNAFEDCNNLENVYYMGFESQWNDVDIGSYNNFLLNAQIHFMNIGVVEENGISYLYLGKYPQTVVDDSTIISALENITTTNDLGYIEYIGNEYKKVTAAPFGSNYTFANGQTIVSGNTYYFKVEPIKWRILESSNGSYKLLSEMLLDSTNFYHTYNQTRTINETTIYPNNYEYSNIRAWLNGYDGTSYNVNNYTNKGFIDIAFTEREKALINETLVDNSLLSTTDSSNQYICDNTTDKIYLLSLSEVTNQNYGFSSDRYNYDTARQATVSDYARSKGCDMATSSSYYGNGYWWLRSPGVNYNYDACEVHYSGLVFDDHVSNSYYAVRAALEITI